MDDPLIATLVSVGGTLAGVLIGALLSARIANLQRQRHQAVDAIGSMAALSDLFWSATPREFAQAWDSLDGQLALAGLSEEPRAALGFIARRCWEDWYNEYIHGAPQEAGVSSRLLEAYDGLRQSITSRLAANGFRQRRKAHAAVNQAVKKAHEIVQARDAWTSA